MDARLKTPFNMQVCGPSQSGKSTWIARLINHHELLLEQPVSEVFWFTPHGHVPDELDKTTAPPVTVFTELPTSWGGGATARASAVVAADSSDEGGFELPNGRVDGKHYMVVLDDFTDEMRNSLSITALFTRGSHHLNISVVQLSQNLFWRSPQASTRALNVHYLVLMRQTRNMQQIKTLAQQAASSPAQRRLILDAYHDATQKQTSVPYTYLFLSFHPRDDPSLMLRTNLFPGEEPWGQVYLMGDEQRPKSSSTSTAPLIGRRIV